MTEPTRRAGIVADDLTGANDSAVQFARRGWRARLVLDEARPSEVDAGSVTAVVTDARAHDDDRASFATCDAVVALAGAGAERVFVKIDSTMRGTVGAQIFGALDAWSVRHPDAVAVVCPAYPAMGRSVEGGRVLVDGAGVQTTSAGRDPVTPVTTDALAELLPGSVHVGGEGTIAEGVVAAAATGSRIVTVDAASDDDLRLIGDAIVALGERCVPVGSAGLATVLAEAWNGRGPARPVAAPARSHRRVVVQVSSLHDVSRAQHAHLVASGSPEVQTFAPTLAEASGADAASAWISARLASDPRLPAVVAVLAPEERANGAGSAELVAAGLAAITDALVHHGDTASALVLMGGEGARAVLSRLGAAAIAVTGAIREGIPVGSVEAGRGHGLTVVTKAGGFGVESSLTDIVRELLRATADHDPAAPRRTA